ncbi:MAG: tRNA (adenosine(37)-N6)-threonylcarbamoyltransferase complex transferase subunit TsaD [Bacillota bacterium]|nr:tRNA (adenosine(37)-N6)-threonylcarbamoyltransferase complex transferase subunit TsaD [Bacillota bacterium]
MVLGLETSCDETAAAVVRGGREICSNVIASQAELHRRYGGVVPEVASRRHLEAILPVVDAALRQAGLEKRPPDLVAVTQGPGLVGSLLVGVALAKALAFAWKVPLVGVNHVEAHLYANFLAHPDLSPPLVCLIVSGGHSELVYLSTSGQLEVLGRTRDDAAGEALDKLARHLGLGYPGGAALEELARKGDPAAVPLPRALAGEETLEMSFSGLKTAALHYLEARGGDPARLPPGVLADLAASYQEAVVDVLVERLMRAAQRKRVRQVALAGGVAANETLRRRVQAEAGARGLEAFFPPPELCTDNAAMVACAGYHRWRGGEEAAWSLNADPSLPLGRVSGGSCGKIVDKPVNIVDFFSTEERGGGPSK